MPFDLITNSTVHELMQRLQQHMDVARSRMEHAQHNQAHYANQRRRDSSFEEGEMVWLSTQNLKLPADTTRKLSTRYTGPFKILEAIGPVNYKLDIPEEWIKKRVHPVFHINLLKRHVPTIDSEDNAEHIADIEPSEQEPEYEVDKIIGKRLGKDKQMEYLILWKGYPESEATWESSDVAQDLEALDEFEDACRVEDKERSIRINKEYIQEKWKKNHVINFIISLVPPNEVNTTAAELAEL